MGSANIMRTQMLTVLPQGQISIPDGILKQMSIDTGDKLLAFVSGDTIILKTVAIPSEDDFDSAALDAQKWAKAVGYEENDVNVIIKEVRQRKRNGNSR